MRQRRLLVIVIALTACGGDDDGALTPVLDDIGPAVTAVEAELGGPQQFFEINATPQLVNLFVAVDGATQVAPYVYVGGELAPAADPAGADGPTFGADALSFDPDTVLDAVAADLPDADVELFSIAGDPLQYRATVQSGDAGSLEVVLAADGSIRSVTPVG